MPSPTCEVKQGAGAYQATTNGVDVTAGGASLTIKLDDVSADTWSIACISTDDLSDKATVNASMTVDPVTKTATLAAPTLAGRAWRFQSIVNQGLGPDGTKQDSLTTTFGIYTTTAGGLRVLAVDETIESNAIFGYIVTLNGLIRNPSAGVGPGGATGSVQVNAGGGAFSGVAAGTDGQVLTSIGGAWVASSQSVTGQTITAPDWYIDPVGGSDANAGTTIGTPLKTWAGLMARWGVGAQLKPNAGGFTTVHLLGDLPQADPIDLAYITLDADANFRLKGQVTTTRTGSFTAVTPQSGNVGWQVTDTGMGLATWTTDLGRRVRVTSGLNINQIVNVAEDLGANKALVSAPATAPTGTTGGYPGPTNGVVQVGDTYAVETLTKVYFGQIFGCGRDEGNCLVHPGRMFFEDVDVQTTGHGNAVVQQCVGAIFVGCHFSTGINVTQAWGAVFANCSGDTGVGVDLSEASFLAGLYRGVGITCEGKSSITIDQGVMAYGSVIGGYEATGGSHIAVGPSGACAFNCAGGGVVVGDSTNQIGPGSLEVDGPLYGSGNAVGVAVDAGATAICSTLPTITGTAGDYTLAGKATALAWNDAAKKYIANALTCSWANLAATVASNGFGGVAHNPQQAARIIDTASINAGVNPYVTTGALYTVAYGVEEVECTAGGFTVTLPAAPYANQVIRILCVVEGGGPGAPASAITIAGNGKNINGAATYVQQYRSEVMRLFYNGTQWRLT